ncbi:MAG: hypothetical protein WC628_04690 [Candidatus Omnitrophota bacterium]
MYQKEGRFGINILFIATLASGIAGLGIYFFVLNQPLSEFAQNFLPQKESLQQYAIFAVLALPMVFIIVPFLLLFTSIWASYNLFAAKTMDYIQAVDDNIAVVRSAVFFISLFSLWLSYLIYQQKKLAWYILVFIFSAAFVSLIAGLSIISINNISLENLGQLVLPALFVINLFWLFYVITIKSYFAY